MKAVYPGTFDPLTKGHLDVIERGKKLFGKLVVGVAENPRKKPLFGIEERVRLIEESTSHLKGVEVKPFSNLLVDFAKEEEAEVILRGLRETSDFPSEFQHAVVNRLLEENIETIFVMTNPDYFYLTSSIVKEIAKFGGNISSFVPKNVEKELIEKFK